ncbi:MAG: tryptophan-rich sensory protein [Sphingobium sp.]|uniref:TspO/MBR family protein n=1 Tax=Sphingobium sp. TaxID=1912891 RepID=UPI0029AE1F29|nr:TspO/MBR family protein [Sphingobium sp.]MDX3908488.1 tryptophan-rich sensory protein [Sphingobium sp.]
MNEIASKGQLRLSYLRWALFIVPTIVFLGFLSGRISNSGYGNPWFDELTKPSAMPPGWAFPVAWTTLYILMALALAMVIDARRAKGRGLAILLFIIQFAGNLAWSPLFFAAHKVTSALYLILLILVVATVTTLMFGRIRSMAAWLMVPYLCWLGFAAALNYDIGRLNPDAETLVVPSLRTQI